MFFFFKQKTAYEMRISDWSSDVCSSDLRPWLALAVRKEAIENLTVDGERFDLGTLGPDRAVVGFRGTAILVVGGVSLKWISGCAQPSLRRLHFVGEVRSEEHTSELQSLMRISYAVFCLKKKKYQYK